MNDRTTISYKWLPNEPQEDKDMDFSRYEKDERHHDDILVEAVTEYQTEHPKPEGVSAADYEIQTQTAVFKRLEKLHAKHVDNAL